MTDPFRDQQGRPYYLELVLGAPGTGKTSLVEQRIEDYRKAHATAEIVILDPNNQFPGRGGIWPPDGDAKAWLLAFKARRARYNPPPPCLLVLDDADRYLTGAPPTGIFRDLFTSFRHWRCDVIVNARRTQDVPKVAIASASFLSLFLHREVYGREYLAKALGPDVIKHLPDERFRYCLVHVDEHRFEPGATKKRAQTHAADTR